MPLREEDGRLYGPGIFDMKAGIAIGMLAARALLTAGRLGDRTLAMLFTGDEERGSASSRELIEKEGRRADAVFVLEPSLPGGAVKTARKGCGEFELRIRGVPAHAGVEPGRGASAIDEMAAQITPWAPSGHRDGVSLNVASSRAADVPTWSPSTRAPSSTRAWRARRTSTPSRTQSGGCARRSIAPP